MSEKKKILLVSNGFYPEISPRSYRATELAKEFIRQGHYVKVITKFRDFNYSEFLKEYKVELDLWGKSRFPQIPDSKRNVFSWITGSLSRALSLLFEYPGIEDMFKVRQMLKSESNFDIMISFAVPYPVHWGVAWARTTRQRIAEVWVADCGDPYMGDIVDTFRKPFYFKYLEKAFCRKADFISIPIEGARDGYYREFHNKIRIIPQGFDFEIDNKTDLFLCNRIPTFAYAGGFIPGVRDPDQLMRFLMSVAKPFRFNIYTNSPESLDKYKKQLDDRLQVSAYIPREELLEVLSQMDFLINFDNNSALNSPSKLIDYSIAGRPVLNIKRDLNQADVRAFLDGNYKNKMILPDPGEYHIGRVAKKFLELSDSN
ncbi:MAG TPA: glycosyltransferase [Desulfobacteraceae bacterium]|jgi:glycosyltransferase involved in cell wall biosynthesis|nr:MAG: hypothetical protein BWX96_02364 [Bacteroidetes bacterium ADurb.Bin145]HPF03108.1 glycosyltransferase [Bacteroidales bacterium]HPQ27564.1 glycosyltransferase [Desulfobacteraceae bacterium]